MTSEVVAAELAELRMFADRAACQALQERWWYGMGMRDVETLVSVFSPDARYMTATGTDAIREVVRMSLTDPLKGVIRETFHIVPVYSLLEVTGDAAHGEFRAVAFIKVAAPEGGEKMEVRGLGYLNSFVRTPHGWRISAMGGIDGGFEVTHDVSWQFDVKTVEPTNRHSRW